MLSLKPASVACKERFVSTRHGKVMGPILGLDARCSLQNTSKLKTLKVVPTATISNDRTYDLLDGS